MVVRIAELISVECAERQVDSARSASLLAGSQMGKAGTQLGVIAAAFLALATSTSCFAQADPAAEPAVLALAKVLPAVGNINTEPPIPRPVRQPVRNFYSQ